MGSGFIQGSTGVSKGRERKEKERKKKGADESALRKIVWAYAALIPPCIKKYPKSKVKAPPKSWPLMAVVFSPHQKGPTCAKKLGLSTGTKENGLNVYRISSYIFPLNIKQNNPTLSFPRVPRKLSFRPGRFRVRYLTAGGNCGA